MIIERNGSSQYKKFSELKPGDVFGIGDGVQMVLNGTCQKSGRAANLRTGAVILVGMDTAVTPYPNATLVI